MKCSNYKNSFILLLCLGWTISTLSSCSPSRKEASETLLVQCDFGKSVATRDSIYTDFVIKAAVIDANGDSLPVAQNVDSIWVYSHCEVEKGKTVQSGSVTRDSSKISECRGGKLNIALNEVSNGGSSFRMNLMVDLTSDENCNGNQLVAGGLIVIVVESLIDPPITIMKESAQGWKNGKPMQTQLN